MNEQLHLIDLAIVGGAALVLPAAAGRWPWAWRAVATTAGLALLLAPSPLAALLALPWVVLALAGAVVELQAVLRRPVRSWTLDLLGPIAVAGWSAVAGAFLVDTCAGRGWLGYGEPIVRLTVVHFTFAGAGTTAMAAAAFAAGHGRGRWRGAALVTVVAAPAVVAAGFVTGAPVLEVGGPIVMAAGAYLVGAANAVDGWSRRSSAGGRLLVASGGSVLVPMVLAVAWALAPHTGGPALSIPDMVRFHGGAQALGFVGCGLAGRWLLRPGPEAAVAPVARPQQEPEPERARVPGCGLPSRR